MIQDQKFQRGAMFSTQVMTMVILGIFVFMCGPVSFAEVAKENTDVQVLQAWTNPAAVELDYKHCEGENPAVPGEITIKDCAIVAPSTSPATVPWLLPVANDRGVVYSRYYVGNIVEIRLVVRRSVLVSPTFNGIGFYAQNMTFQGQHFIPKDRLKIVGQDVFLAENGERAAVLSFVLWFPGEQGQSSTGWNRQSVEFKPFAEFTEDGEVYRNWEVIPRNFRVYRAPSGGGTPQVTSINRENELLRR